MGEDNEGGTSKKAHRQRHSGRKAERKKDKKQSNPNDELTDRQRNPKAFAFNSAVRAERKFRRKQDVDTKKQHIPLVDRTPLEPPPILVAVVGPPKVGKSTLIINLIKLFTKSPLTEIKGPVTIVIGKKRRLTLIECNNDINSMIDLAKVADLVLLLCDASFGFEMEIFEFLNICQVHGMPRIMGVLTHLDMIKNKKTLKNTKKTLKHRFWTEVYAGAKLFYLSGIIHGEYLRNEIKNLGRFISVMKFRPLTWRTNHSYLLGDRFEDLTSLELVRQNPSCDRTISLYGYIRGIPLSKNTSVHIAGLGDLPIQEISFLPDPCPLPDAIKKRALIEKEKMIYAPFSGVGGIVYDKDAVYVELGGSHSHKESENEASNIVANIIDTQQTLNDKMQQSELQIFSTSEKMTSRDLDDTSDDEDETDNNRVTLYSGRAKEKSELEEQLAELHKKRDHQVVEFRDDAGRVRRKVIFNDEESDGDDEDTSKNVESDYTTLQDNQSRGVLSKVQSALRHLNEKKAKKEEEEDESSEDSDVETDEEMQDDEADEGIDCNVQWKENLAEKARSNFLTRQSETKNLMKLVYGVFDKKRTTHTSNERMDVDNTEENDEIGGLFKVVSYEQQREKIEKDTMDLVESSLPETWATTKNWLDEENRELIVNCFVTGKWKSSEDAEELLRLDDAQDSDGESDVFGDFEDLETGEKHANEGATESRGEKRKLSEANDGHETTESLSEKKKRLKERFDAEYDTAEKNTYYDELKMNAEKQAQLNKTIFDSLPDDLRVEIEGYRPGMYVRIEFKSVPVEFVDHFDANYPIVLGALNLGEENIGYVNVKIKKHRWYKKILKTNDPLILSLGWRRFQTIPIYSKLEDDLKFRYLKYTPEHVTCNAHFWGPITPQGTGFIALQSCESNPDLLKQCGFRIAATGAVQELDKSTQIMKKLKLIGTPLKIFKKTAFIQGMFNSSLEVAKFEGARVKTVSGIRGQIKKAESKPEGCFRATFEDKIKLSDIVFCRTWFKVDVMKFYNPVITLLLPPEQRSAWRGARTTGAIKREKGVMNLPNQDSMYREIVRDPKVFKPLVIPRKLQEALPYKDKPKFGVLRNEQKKPFDRVAVIREPHEQKVSTMMKMLRASFSHKEEAAKQATKERLEKHRKEIEAIEVNKNKKLKEQKKQVMRVRSKAQLKKK